MKYFILLVVVNTFSYSNYQEVLTINELVEDIQEMRKLIIHDTLHYHGIPIAGRFVLQQNVPEGLSHNVNPSEISQRMQDLLIDIHSFDNN